MVEFVANFSGSVPAPSLFSRGDGENLEVVLGGVVVFWARETGRLKHILVIFLQSVIEKRF